MQERGLVAERRILIEKIDFTVRDRDWRIPYLQFFIWDNLFERKKSSFALSFFSQNITLQIVYLLQLLYHRFTIRIIEFNFQKIIQLLTKKRELNLMENSIFNKANFIFCYRKNVSRRRSEKLRFSARSYFRYVVEPSEILKLLKKVACYKIKQKLQQNILKF